MIKLFILHSSSSQAKKYRNRDNTSPVILTGNDHRLVVVEELRKIDLKPEAIFLELDKRNTTPAGLIAALIATNLSPDALVIERSGIARSNEIKKGRSTKYDDPPSL